MTTEMKKTIISILMAFAIACPDIFAGIPAEERTYISTDRQIYMAGDEIRCSAFCIDVSDGIRLSEVSALAYVELHSAEGLACTAKIALIGGRGAGAVKLPKSLPTGNYRLFAYTALNKSEKGYDYMQSCKTVSIFNPYTDARVKGGVEIVANSEYGIPAASDNAAASGELQITAGKTASINSETDIQLSNLSAVPASLSVSVVLNDGMISPLQDDVVSFAEHAGKPDVVTYKDGTIPEYEGEIIHARVSGISPENMNVLNGKFAFISAPGDKSDVYSTSVEPDGTMSFFTNNIYGDKDLVCEIEDIPDDIPCHIEIIPAFANPDVTGIESLKICPGLESKLTRRSLNSQVEHAFASDTLLEFLPVRENLLFRSDGVTYKLDDYTRFPLMTEVISEFVTELRAKKRGGKRELSVMYDKDNLGNIQYSRQSALVMLDGVPVFDHDKILEYDPLLVESINIYDGVSFIGNRSYEGIANFVTYKRNLPSLKFGGNVRVHSFQGASVPSAFTCSQLPDGYPDYRTTLYWHPEVDLEPGESLTIRCKTPGYEGNFDIIVEGIGRDGRPIMQKATFKVE